MDAKPLSLPKTKRRNHKRDRVIEWNFLGRSVKAFSTKMLIEASFIIMKSWKFNIQYKRKIA